MPRRPNLTTHLDEKLERRLADLHGLIALRQDELDRLYGERTRLFQTLYHDNGYTHRAIAVAANRRLTDDSPRRLSEDAVEKTLSRFRRASADEGPWYVSNTPDQRGPAAATKHRDPFCRTLRRGDRQAFLATEEQLAACRWVCKVCAGGSGTESSIRST